jgi:hypothetical protein
VAGMGCPQNWHRENDGVEMTIGQEIAAKQKLIIGQQEPGGSAREKLAADIDAAIAQAKFASPVDEPKAPSAPSEELRVWTSEVERVRKIVMQHASNSLSMEQVSEISYAVAASTSADLVEKIAAMVESSRFVTQPLVPIQETLKHMANKIRRKFSGKPVALSVPTGAKRLSSDAFVDFRHDGYVTFSGRTILGERTTDLLEGEDGGSQRQGNCKRKRGICQAVISGMEDK